MADTTINERQDYDAVQCVVDGVDEVARQQECKWGVGRLDLLVSNELRQKFRRQLERFNEAIRMNDVARVVQAGEAMKRGWLVLDQAATVAGAVPLEPGYWEFRLDDGKVVALCRGTAEAYAVAQELRDVEVWSALEIIELIENKHKTLAGYPEF